MSQKQTSIFKALAQIAGMTAGFALVLGLARVTFTDHLRPAVPPTPKVEDFVTVDGFTLTSASIELPEEESAFPEHPGAELVTMNCTACHSASMVLSQATFSKDQWTATVEKMRTTYKASIAEENIPAIVDYLSRISAQTAAGVEAAAMPATATEG